MKAIVVIDMVNDFVKVNYVHDGANYKGTLVAPLGETIIKSIGRFVDAGLENDLYEFFLQDEHTPESKEIKSGAWPEHCIKETPGAETITELKKDGKRVYTIKKDYYNAFTNPELNELLEKKEITEVYLTGLVQEICVKENAEGFLEHGYNVNVVVDATAPFNSFAGYQALKELEQKGARMVDLETALEEIAK